MKPHIRLTVALVAMILAGCSTQTKPPAKEIVHEQGWIGGSFKCAEPKYTLGDWLLHSGGDDIIYCFPSDLRPSYQRGILVTELPTNSPAYRGGLRAGDLILEVNHHHVSDLTTFLASIQAAHPGESLPVKFWREGRAAESAIPVGVEKFRHEGTFYAGLPGFYDPPHLVPTHDQRRFSLVVLGWEGPDTSPTQFGSVEEQYRLHCHPKDQQKGTYQDWKCWLAIFQVSKSRTILAQETSTNAIPSR